MTTLDIAALVNLLGWTFGFALYLLLLVMTLPRRRARGGYGGSPPRDALPFMTALLGSVWNAGALVTLDGYGLPQGAARSLVASIALAALGLLPAVVVHSALVGRADARGGRRRARAALIVTAYLLSSLAGAWHILSALRSQAAGSRGALQALTIGYLLLMTGLFALTRREPGGRRAGVAAALAVFAVSALHLADASDASHGRWYLELVGHHASLPLALAILLQDYRFAFADLFLKRALALVALVAVGGVTLAGLLWLLGAGQGAGVTSDARSLIWLLAAWTATALAYPRLKDWSERFVDRVVLRRYDYAELRAELSREAQQHESTSELLDHFCLRLGAALTARAVTWREATGDPALVLHAGAPDEPISPALDAEAGAGGQAVVRVPAAEVPRYELLVGELVGGRRLLSDDLALLEWTALALARRIDSLRHAHERCEQDRRAEESLKLASEAQLRLLRAQINPHFLFNALTTIGYLIQTSPEQALATLLRLTDLLRRVLRAPAEWTTLGEELRLVEAYLDVERARFEERLRVRVDVPADLRGLAVPSLVIQPLVENSLKHGITPQRAGGEVTLRAAAEPDALKITIADTGAGADARRLAAGRAAGVGLQNVEQRLRLCCGERARMTIESEPGKGTIVELRLPLRTTPSASPRADVPAGAANGRAGAGDGAETFAPVGAAEEAR